MSSKLSWITFIPFTLAAMAIKVAQIFFLTDENSTLFGLSSFQLSYVALGCVVLVFIFSIIFILADRKTAPYYKGGRNIACGIIGLLTAIVFACDGANRIFNTIQLGDYQIIPIIDSVLTLVSAVVFVVLSLSCFTGGTASGNGLAVFYLLPAVWSAFRLVTVFLTFTTVSILTVDVTRLVTYIFLTLFLFNYAILVSSIKGKSPVKTTFVYGFAACSVLCTLSAYSVSLILVSEDFSDIFSYAEDMQVVLLALYVLVFLIELTLRVKNKSEIKVVDYEDDRYKGDKESSDDDLMIDDERDRRFANDFITGLDEETVDKAPLHSYLETQDTSDFLYRPTQLGDDSNVSSVRYGNIDEKEIDDYITTVDTTYKDTGDNEDTDVSGQPRENKYESRMDEIDKLILEISGDKK